MRLLTGSFSPRLPMKRPIPAMVIHMPGKIKERGFPLFARWKNKLPFLIVLINGNISLMDIPQHWHWHFESPVFVPGNIPFLCRLSLVAYTAGLRPMGAFMRQCDSNTISISGRKSASFWLSQHVSPADSPFRFVSIGPPDRICLKFHAKLV